MFSFNSSLMLIRECVFAFVCACNVPNNRINKQILEHKAGERKRAEETMHEIENGPPYIQR